MLRRLPALLLRAPRAAAPPGARGFGLDSHTSENDPRVLEHAKRKHLKGESKSPIKEAPGWEEKLASDSEAIVKADQSSMTVEEMTVETIEALHHKAGAGAPAAGGDGRHRGDDERTGGGHLEDERAGRGEPASR